MKAEKKKTRSLKKKIDALEKICGPDETDHVKVLERKVERKELTINLES